MDILKSTCPFSLFSQYCLPASSSPLQAMPAHVSFPCPSPTPVLHWVSVEFWFPGCPLRCPTEPPGGYTGLNKSQHSHGVWGGTHCPPGSIQCWRPLIAPTAAASQSSAVPSGNAGESMTAAQSILSPTVHWVQLPAFALAGLFLGNGCLGKAEMECCQNSPGVIFANALESWLFSQGQHGLFAKATDSTGILTDNVGRGESILFASTNNRARGRESMQFLQSSFHPSPASKQVSCS